MLQTDEIFCLLRCSFPKSETEDPPNSCPAGDGLIAGSTIVEGSDCVRNTYSEVLNGEGSAKYVIIWPSPFTFIMPLHSKWYSSLLISLWKNVTKYIIA